MKRLCQFFNIRAVLLVTLAGLPLCAHSQELEPRAYSASPVGTNFLLSAYAYSTGDVAVDASLPLEDVDARLHTGLVGYLRSFSMFGRAVNAGVVLPFGNAHVEGMVGEEDRAVTRVGLGDARVRFSTLFLGGKALTHEEFALQKPDLTAGLSFSMVLPTGEYTSERLINLGSNRIAFKSEIGGSYNFDNWFFEGSTGVWLFSDNQKFFGDVEREQDPITTFQVHTGYTFLPGMWLAGNATYYTGGRTTVGGDKKDDMQENSRYGLTFSLPLDQHFSFKLAWSKGFTTRIGGDFSTVAATIQYRWFDDELRPENSPSQ